MHSIPCSIRLGLSVTALEFEYCCRNPVWIETSKDVKCCGRQTAHPLAALVRGQIHLLSLVTV